MEQTGLNKNDVYAQALKIKMKTCKTGKFAERLACLYLFCKGYNIVARNQITGKGTGAGEVDIVARRGKTLVLLK